MFVVKILVVEDEEDIQELISYNMKKENFKVLCISSGEETLKYAEVYLPDLIVLDIMLPGISGFDVCKILKNKKTTQNIPIIMATAKGEESDIVTGLELGADDYITKPFSPKVLIARVKAVLRRKSKNSISSDKLNYKELLIHIGRHEVYIKDTKIDLTFSEFVTLCLFVKNLGWVYTRNQIIDAVHGDNYPVTDRSIDVLIVSLRKKLGEYGKLIETVRGIGYRFKD